MTYALLIYSRLTPGESLSPEREERVLVEHRALQEETARAGTLKAVSRLADTRGACTVRVSGGDVNITDGPFMETKEWLVGFYVVDAASRDEAVAHARRLLPDETHCIEVRPVDWHRDT